jgi:hypothetical protein
VPGGADELEQPLVGLLKYARGREPHDLRLATEYSFI